MNKSNIELEMVSAKNNRPMNEYSHEGKTFIESREGSTYALRIKNNTGQRVLAIVSIDSLNAITGKESTDSSDEAGYIVPAYGSYLVKGFRVDDDTVAAFSFVKKGKSYATSVGSGGGNGVVAVRIFEEKQKPAPSVIHHWHTKIVEKPVYPPYDYFYWSTTCSTVTPDSFVTFCNNSVNADEQVRGGEPTKSAPVSSINLCSSSQKSMLRAAKNEDVFSHGTKFGEATIDKVTTVTFEVGTLIAELVLYYAPRAALESLGINFIEEKHVVFPEPFKREYAKPPSGWHR